MIITKKINTNGIMLHVAFAGPDDGEPVFLLHGFPDFWFCWEDQINALANQGFRVVAPDQRGFNQSEKPKGIDAYSQRTLAADIIGLADFLGYNTFNLAGHDFGGIVCWTIAELYPESIKKLVILSAPHLVASVNYSKINISQKFKSWYVLFFQLAYLPEKLIGAFNFALLVRSMPSSFSESEINRYRTAWSQVNGLKSMINWYRAYLRDIKKRAIEFGIVDIPTHIIWGQNDKYLEPGLAELSLEQCSNGKITVFEDCSHWVMHDRSDEVSKILIKHFSQT